MLAAAAAPHHGFQFLTLAFPDPQGSVVVQLMLLCCHGAYVVLSSTVASKPYSTAKCQFALTTP